LVGGQGKLFSLAEGKRGSDWKEEKNATVMIDGGNEVKHSPN